MSDKLLIHIPHASLELPDIFWDNVINDRKRIEEENLFMTDYLLDMFVPESRVQIIKFGYSRLFCDVERFADDNQEEMAKFGMGVIYTSFEDGSTFKKYDGRYKELVFQKYYNVHHKQLDDIVSQIVECHQECYILDLHSFSDDFVREVLQKEDNPDICLGIDEGFYDEELLNITKYYFESKGYSIRINYPYGGSIVPNKFFNDIGKKVVKSMMVEINKRIYLDNNRDINEKKVKYLKEVMDGFYNLVDDYLKKKKLGSITISNSR